MKTRGQICEEKKANLNQELINLQSQRTEAINNHNLTLNNFDEKIELLKLQIESLENLKV